MTQSDLERQDARGHFFLADLHSSRGFTQNDQIWHDNKVEEKPVSIGVRHAQRERSPHCSVSQSFFLESLSQTVCPRGPKFSVVCSVYLGASYPILGGGSSVPQISGTSIRARTVWKRTKFACWSNLMWWKFLQDRRRILKRHPFAVRWLITFLLVVT